MEVGPQNHTLHGLSFAVRKEHAMISNLLGLLGGEMGPVRGMAGLFKLQDETGFYDGQDIPVTWFSIDESSVKISAQSPDTEITMLFTYKDGVWSRRDSLKNLKKGKSKITCVRQKFLLRGYDYEVFTQEGGWITENQGSWKKMLPGGAHTHNIGSRTCDGAQPFMAIKNPLQGNGVAFDLLPCGKWSIDADSVFNSYCPAVSISMGMPENDFELVLEENETVDLPEILFWSFESGDNSMGSHKLHEFLIKNRMTNKELPVYWNSWFFDFDRLDYDKFIKEADAAAELGCEYYVVDAGWFGDERWETCVGTWKETETSAFRGKMKDLADYVRSLGMKFGLWIEPERVVNTSELYKEHSDWVINNNGFSGQTNFALPKVHEYFDNIISGLIEKYGIEFIKFDMNVEGDRDETGSCFFRYYQGYYRFYEAFRKKHPNVYFEFCSSGGLRSDTKNICMADSHFLSDTINPVDSLSILQGACMRAPSSMISKWHGVVESDSLRNPIYGEKQKKIVACADATWESGIEVCHHFMEAFMMLGPWGFTSKISDYSDEYRNMLKNSVELFKKYRGFIKNSSFRTLTPIKNMYDRKGPVIFQLSDVYEDRHIITVFKLEEFYSAFLVQPKGIDPNKKYAFRYIRGGQDATPSVISGKEILEGGIPAVFEAYKYSALMIEIAEVK